MREIPRLSEDEIKTMAMDLLRHNLFAASMAPLDLVPMIFMPLALGALLDVDVEQIGNIVENMSEAGPHGINGYPMFMSCRVVHKDDWSQVVDRYDAAHQAMETALEGDTR